ncbi:hypothetical protein [Streptomyces lonarensis]|uniref:Uncharacterized protein n=1 Tax=Streptomyces lonarensis TaxID=700599 RepID=A0A7X6D178_9ACTN|nr:hypothetical protein [Streptomyces lonarensis]NJQ06347.1 hypothetical protein [Streptomyces lonarensis]
MSCARFRPQAIPSPPGGQFVDGYWAEAVVRSSELGRDWYLAGAWLDTPAGAVDWLHDRAARLVSALETSDRANTGHTPHPVAAVFREWSADTVFRSVQCAALADLHPISANARGRDRVQGSVEADVLYSLSARPILRPSPRG